MKPTGIAICFALFALLSKVAVADTICANPLSVEDVIRRAQSLNGKRICVRAWVVNDSQVDPDTVVVKELVSVGHSTRHRALQRQTIGAIEWSADSGVTEAEFKPDSFRRLENVLLSRPQPRFVEVVAAGVLFRNRYFGARAADGSTDDRVRRALGKNAHAVELVITEIASAKAIQ